MNSTDSNRKEKKLQQLNINDTTYSTLYTRKYANRKPWIEANPHEIKTFIPGTVITLSVKEGSVVNEGDVLMTYEAMKMLNLVKAPHGGVVRNIRIKEGDKLPKGFVMLEIA